MSRSQEKKKCLLAKIAKQERKKLNMGAWAPSFVEGFLAFAIFSFQNEEATRRSERY